MVPPLLSRLAAALLVGVIYFIILMSNPYVTHVAYQEGISESEVLRTCTRSSLTLGDANAHGFDTVEEYEEALYDFLNGM